MRIAQIFRAGMILKEYDLDVYRVSFTNGFLQVALRDPDRHQLQPTDLVAVYPAHYFDSVEFAERTDDATE